MSEMLVFQWHLNTKPGKYIYLQVSKISQDYCKVDASHIILPTCCALRKTHKTCGHCSHFCVQNRLSTADLSELLAEMALATQPQQHTRGAQRRLTFTEWSCDSTTWPRQASLKPALCTKVQGITSHLSLLVVQMVTGKRYDHPKPEPTLYHVISCMATTPRQ